MPTLVEVVTEHAAQIQAHTRTAMKEIADHLEAHPDEKDLVAEAGKVLSDAASDAVATLKAGPKSEAGTSSSGGATGATGASGAHPPSGGGSQRRE